MGLLLLLLDLRLELLEEELQQLALLLLLLGQQRLLDLLQGLDGCSPTKKKCNRRLTPGEEVKVTHLAG